MATDFFENQDIARRNTGRLVVLFALAVLAIVATLYALAVAITGYQGVDPATGATRIDLTWWNPDLLVQVGLATLAVVAGGSLYKTAQLRAGGRVVAESLGGRLLHGDSGDPAERVLLNVVDEMALASGTASPPVYLLDGESGLNAFAAGFTPDDAVIGVTRGCVDQLTRAELQGVIAHEFSHVLNGDMGLNIRLMGVIHGILLIGIIGYFVLRSAMFSGASRRGGRDNNGAPLLAIGFGLMVVGFLGTLFGNLIKASVSRQREFLADASAVQFTRDPSGIAGALKKIGGFELGSRIEHPNAPEASHMFFSQGITSGLNSLFATHPPLTERIARLDPSFRGSAAGRAPAGEPSVPARAGVSGLAPAGGTSFEQIGQATPDHLAYARELLGALPEGVREAAHEPYGARAVCYALLIDRDPEVRRSQLAHLADHADAGVAAETERLLDAVAAVEPRVRLPLIDLLVPALRELSPEQYASFEANVARLIGSDGKIDVFEWTLQRILMRHLASGFTGARPRRRRTIPLERSLDHARVVLSTLAHAGGRNDGAARGAFDLGARDLGFLGLERLPVGDCGLAPLDAALSALDALAPGDKRRLIHACATVVAADGAVGVREAELLRAVADSLGCPMPPLLPGQPLV